MAWDLFGFGKVKESLARLEATVGDLAEILRPDPWDGLVDAARKLVADKEAQCDAAIRAEAKASDFADELARVKAELADEREAHALTFRKGDAVAAELKRTGKLLTDAEADLAIVTEQAARLSSRLATAENQLAAAKAAHHPCLAITPSTLL